MVGDDVDAHGCKASAGFVWCEISHTCIQPWIKNCTSLTTMEEPRESPSSTTSRFEGVSELEAVVTDLVSENPGVVSSIIPPPTAMPTVSKKPTLMPTVSIMPRGTTQEYSRLSQDTLVGLTSESVIAASSPGDQSSQALASVQFNVSSYNVAMTEIIQASEIRFDLMTMDHKLIATQTCKCHTVTFSNLTQGTYELHFAIPGYETFNKTLTVMVAGQDSSISNVTRDDFVAHMISMIPTPSPTITMTPKAASQVQASIDLVPEIPEDVLIIDSHPTPSPSTKPSLPVSKQIMPQETVAGIMPESLTTRPALAPTNSHTATPTITMTPQQESSLTDLVPAKPEDVPHADSYPTTIPSTRSPLIVSMQTVSMTPKLYTSNSSSDQPSGILASIQISITSTSAEMMEKIEGAVIQFDLMTLDHNLVATQTCTCQTVTFSNVTQGAYELVYTISGYAKFTKNITVKIDTLESEIGTTSGPTIDYTPSPIPMLMYAPTVPKGSMMPHRVTEINDLSTGSLHGTIYNDTNGNAEHDTSDRTLSNISVKVTGDGGVSYATATNSDGFWELTNLTAGSYNIEISLGLPFFSSSSPDGKITDVSVIAGGSTTVDYFVYGISPMPNSTTEITLTPTRAPLPSKAPYSGPTTIPTLTPVEKLSSSTLFMKPQPQVDSEIATTKVPILPPTVIPDITTGSLSGVIYMDLNGDKDLDENEETLSNIPVKVTNVLSGALYETVTDVDGFWEFSNVAAGTYSVEFTFSADYESSAPNNGKIPEVMITAGETTVLDYYLQSGTISGIVYTDNNGNGVQEAIEAGIVGALVQIYSASDSVSRVCSTETDSSGMYSCDGLILNQPYNVVVEAVSPTLVKYYTGIKMNSTSGIAGPFTLSIATPSVAVNVGIVLQKMPLEPTSSTFMSTSIAPTSAVLSPAAYESASIAPTSAVSSPTTYESASLKPTYSPTALDGAIEGGLMKVIPEAMPSNSGLVAPEGEREDSKAPVPAPTEQFTVAVGGINGTLYKDINGNGRKDDGEETLPDVPVKVVGSDGATYETATDSNGVWEVTNIKGGTYAIEFSLGSEYLSSAPQGGKIEGVTVTAGMITTVDYYLLLGTIRGKIYVDETGDALLEGNEVGLVGIPVQISLGAGGQPLCSTTTDASGMYSCSGLLINQQYYVAIIAPNTPSVNYYTGPSVNRSTGIAGPVTMSLSIRTVTVNIGIVFHSPLAPSPILINENSLPTLSPSEGALQGKKLTIRKSNDIPG
jgi:hypothetical protein